jgi:hypothetical protein
VVTAVRKGCRSEAVPRAACSGPWNLPASVRADMEKHVPSQGVLVVGTLPFRTGGGPAVDPDSATAVVITLPYRYFSCTLR